MRTMYIMTYELIKMPIAGRSLVDRDPVCEPSKQRAWEFSQRMQRKAIADS